jgi:hypothetical protein
MFSRVTVMALAALSSALVLVLAASAANAQTPTPSPTATATGTPTPTPAPTAPVVDPVSVQRQLLDADNRGDVQAALAFFTDDAAIDGLGLCTPTPCVGKDAIRRDLERGEAGHTVHLIQDATFQASGTTVSGRIPHQNDDSRAAGVDRFIVLTTSQVRSGQVARLHRELDTADPQTAKFAAFQRAAAQAAAPTPARTGNAGLLSAAAARTPFEAQIVLLLVVGGAVIGARTVTDRSRPQR